MFLRDLITLLEGAGVGTYGQNLFMSTRSALPMLASGAATLNVIATGGTSPDNTQNSPLAPAYIRPGAQITARASTYSAAEAMAQAAYAALFITNQYVNSGWYLSIRPSQEPFDGGPDSRGQIQVQFNVLAKRRRNADPPTDWLAYLTAHNASETMIAQVRQLFARVPGLKIATFDNLPAETETPLDLLTDVTVYGAVIFGGLIDQNPVNNEGPTIDSDIEFIANMEVKQTGEEKLSVLPDGLAVGVVQLWYYALDTNDDPVPAGDRTPENSPVGFVMYV